ASSSAVDSGAFFSRKRISLAVRAPKLRACLREISWYSRCRSRCFRRYFPSGAYSYSSGLYWYFGLIRHLTPWRGIPASLAIVEKLMPALLRRFISAVESLDLLTIHPASDGG